MSKIKVDYSELLERAKKQGYNQKELAAAANISESHFCLKLSSEYAFKQTEIQRICEILSIDEEEIGRYFFRVVSCEKATAD